MSGAPSGGEPAPASTGLYEWPNLRHRIESGRRQIAAVGGGLVALIAIGFGDLTGVIAATETVRFYLGVSTTATATAGFVVGVGWAAFNDAVTYANRVEQRRIYKAQPVIRNGSIERLVEALSKLLRDANVDISSEEVEGILRGGRSVDEIQDVPSPRKPIFFRWLEGEDNLDHARRNCRAGEWLILSAVIIGLVGAAFYLIALWTWVRAGG